MKDLQPEQQRPDQPTSTPVSAAPQPSPAPATAPAAGPALSPTTVAYLFASRFVPLQKPGKSGMKAFGTGEVVVTSELSGGLVAIALWQLRERGAVRLEAYSGRKLGFIPESGVRVKLRDGTVPAAGVERAVLDHLQRSKKARNGGERAWDVANMICRDGKDPRGTIIRMAIDEAVAAGYLERTGSEAGVIGRLAGKPKTRLEPHADRIATLAPAAETLAVQWRDFRKGPEADMAKLLRSTTFEGIEVQVRSKDDSDWD